MTSGKSKEANFEKSMERLAGIVERLEAGDLNLDESLMLYEEGVNLSQVCAKRLESARSRIEVLTRKSSGDFILKEARSKGRKARESDKSDPA